MVKKLQEFYEKYFKSAVLQRLFYTRTVSPSMIPSGDTPING
jgi:hypothetical protein